MDTTWLDNIYKGTTGYVYLWTPQKKLSYPFPVSQTAAMMDKAVALTEQQMDVFYSLGVTRKPLKTIRERVGQLFLWRPQIYIASCAFIDIV